MICSKCGKQVKEGTKFCTYCGAPIGGQAPVKPQAAPPKVPASAPKSAPRPSDSGKTSPLQYVLWAFAALSVIAGLLKWLKLKIPFANLFALFMEDGRSFPESMHLTQLISLLKDLKDLAKNLGGFLGRSAEAFYSNMEFITNLMLAVLIIWLIGVILTVVGYVMAAMKKKQMSNILFMVSSLFKILSVLAFVFMISQGKREVIEMFVMLLGRGMSLDVIQIGIGPWLTLVTSIITLVLSIVVCVVKDKKPVPVTPVRPVTPAKPVTPVKPVTPAKPAAPEPIKPIPPVNTGRQVMPVNMEDDDKTAQLSNPKGFLLLRDLKDDSKIYGCDLENPAIAGRDAAAVNVVISGEKSVSRRHCRFYKSGSVCYVEDLNSANHTYVNRQIVTKPTPLRKGDKLQLGNLELIVEECDMLRS